MSTVLNRKAWPEPLSTVVNRREKIQMPKFPGYPAGVPKGKLTSFYFTHAADMMGAGVRARIQACADNHASHIAFGQRGLYVSWIKEALQHVILPTYPQYIPTPDNSPHDVYGPATRHCVLQYKQINHIVNREYQTEPDDIIGIMTIRALDWHMAYREARQK